MNEEAPSPATSSLPDPLTQALENLGGQNAFLRQQVGQVHEAIRLIHQGIQNSNQQLLESHRALQQELHRSQTGGPQRAMAAVFHKLFRDLIGHVGQLDDLVGVARATASEPAWVASLGVGRDHFEKVLADWGCVPIPVRVGVDEFDPEIHEAAAAEGDEIPADAPPHGIVKVRRRGWKLLDHVLQHPVVVVS